MHGNYLTIQRPENDGKLVDRDLRLISPEEGHNRLVHQMWWQLDQRSVSKCAETARQIKGQKTVEIQ